MESLREVLKAREPTEETTPVPGCSKNAVEVKTPSGKKEEEEGGDKKPQVYTDSSTFLKGTQSSNPHNDYCQHFVDTGQRPQNFIRDVGLADRFEEYPKLKELIRLKVRVSYYMTHLGDFMIWLTNF